MTELAQAAMRIRNEECISIVYEQKSSKSGVISDSGRRTRRQVSSECTWTVGKTSE